MEPSNRSTHRIPPFLALFLPLFLSFALPACPEGARVDHTPPAPPAAGETVEIVFRVAGEEEPVAADLWVRKAGEDKYERIAAEERKGIYRTAIPAALCVPPGFEYYILVRTAGGDEISSPPRSPGRSPHEVRVFGPAATDRIVVLSPEPGAVVAGEKEMFLSVLFDPPLLPGDSTLLFLDGIEAAGAIEATEDYLIWHPGSPLSAGAHRAVAVVIGASGGRSERRWTFYYGEESGPGRDLSLSGKIEVGWAMVESRGIGGDPYLPYDKTSSLLFDLYGYGDVAGRSLYFSASRDPIYDDEIRATARLTGEQLAVEVGDIYPTFSELTVSWLSGEGGSVRARGGGWENSLFFVRTLPSDTTGGFGTYSQFIAGERLAYERERWKTAVNAAFGWERESSIPDSLRFLAAIRNRVVTGSGSVRLAGEMNLHLEAGWSKTEGDDTTAAGATRAIMTFFDSRKRKLSVEYHDYATGFYTLGSPTVDGGERGFLIDGSLRLGPLVRQSLKAEIYEDRESSLEIEEGGRIVQIYGRTDFDWESGGVDWNPYLLFRTYEIPYTTNRYTSRYGTAGLYARAGSHTFSLGGTLSESRSSSRTRTWSGSGTWTGRAPGTRLSWKLGERYSHSEAAEDTTGAGAEVTVSRQTRWTFTAELGIERKGIEWRAEYERIDEEDPVEEERYTQHLAALLAARRF